MTDRDGSPTSGRYVVTFEPAAFATVSRHLGDRLGSGGRDLPVEAGFTQPQEIPADVPALAYQDMGFAVVDPARSGLTLEALQSLPGVAGVRPEHVLRRHRRGPVVARSVPAGQRGVPAHGARGSRYRRRAAHGGGGRSVPGDGEHRIAGAARAAPGARQEDSFEIRREEVDCGRHQ